MLAAVTLPSGIPPAQLPTLAVIPGAHAADPVAPPGTADSADSAPATGPTAPTACLPPASQSAPAPAKPRRRGGWRERCQGRGGNAQPPSLFLWNARGVMARPAKGEVGVKLAELAQWMAVHKPGLVCVTESHLDDSFLDGELVVPGYQPPFRCDRNLAVSVKRKKRSGGVLVYAEEGRAVTLVSTAANSGFEGIALRDDTAGLLYAFIYRSGGNIPELTDWLTQQAAQADPGRKPAYPLVVTGDLNMDTRKPQPQPWPLHAFLRAQPGLEQRIRFPTRYTYAKDGTKSGTGSTIDHFWSSFPCRCRPIRSFGGGYPSDHIGVSIFHNRSGKRPATRTRTQWIRRWHKSSPQAIADQVRSHMQRGMASTAGTAGAVTKAWGAAWAHITKKVVPATKCKQRPCKTRLHWISAATKGLMRGRNSLRKRLDRVSKRTPRDEDRVRAAAAAYDTAKKEAAHAFRREQREDLRQQWAKAGPSALGSERWRVFNRWRGKTSQPRPEPGCSANKVNECFLNKVSQIRHKLQGAPPPQIHRKAQKRTLSAMPKVTSEEVLRNLARAKATTSAAAFDTVPHALLIHKLRDCHGVQGQPLALLAHYFEGRRQCVRLSGGRLSSWGLVPSGVAQGAVLSPLLYTLHTSDIEQQVTQAKVVQFADDVTLVARGPTISDAKRSMNAALQEYHRWAISNGILPEPTKTQLLLSASPAKLRRAADVVCAMASVDIPPAETMRVLGAVLDPQVTWEPHAAAAASRTRRAALAVWRAARFLPRPDRARLMEMLALPYLDYAQLPMVHAAASSLTAQRRAYNFTARIAAAQKHSRPALAKLRWPCYERRRAAQRAAEVSALWHSQEPRRLRALLPGSPDDQIVSRRARLPPQPVRTAFGQKCLAHWGPVVLSQITDGTVFNGLPEPSAQPPAPKRAEKTQPQAPSDEHQAQRAAYQAEAMADHGAHYEVTLPCSHQPITVGSGLWQTVTLPVRPRQTQPPLRPEEVMAACRGSAAFRSLFPELSNPTAAETGRRVFVWGDGSASEGRAGYGVYYGASNPRNTAARCEGHQTNNRAELSALLHCLRNDPRPLLFVTDSKYVRDG
eukprot:gene8597-4072_t